MTLFTPSSSSSVLKGGQFSRSRSNFAQYFRVDEIGYFFFSFFLGEVVEEKGRNLYRKILNDVDVLKTFEKNA